MANISTYPIGTPAAADLVPGTQLYTDSSGKTRNLTKNFSVSSIAAFANSYSLGYTVYTSLVSQSSTSAPQIASTLANTTGGDPVWAYVSAGIYTLTFPFSFADNNKVVVFVNNGNVSPTQNVGWSLTSAAGQIRFNTQSDGNLSKASLEVRIYS